MNQENRHLAKETTCSTQDWRGPVQNEAGNSQGMTLSFDGVAHGLRTAFLMGPLSRAVGRLFRRRGGAYSLRSVLSRFAAVAILLPASILAADRVQLSGHVPAELAQMDQLERLPAEQVMKLSIGFPLRNKPALTNLLQQIYNRGSLKYRQFLTPAQFSAMFGPTEQDYQAAIALAKAYGLKPVNRHPNRMILEVEGPVSSVEHAFQVTMGVYRHPTENRNFYAPNVEPSVPPTFRIQDISGLDNISPPKPQYRIRPGGGIQPAGGAAGGATPNVGSGPAGTYLGNDFRAAYAPGVTRTGSGQSVGLVQFDGYFVSDIRAYESLAGLPPMNLVNVMLDGFNGQPTGNGGEVEVCLDIQMAESMAPGLSNIVVYMAGPSGIPNNVLNRIATDNLAKQIGCSWGWGGGPKATTEQIFLQMAAQGQSFFTASGDSDAFLMGQVDSPFFPGSPSSSPNVTSVGGTTLTTSGPGGAWVSETVWNWSDIGLDGIGSSGGNSSFYTIPSWQVGIDMTLNGGSTFYRNIPDVTMVGDDVFVFANGSGSANGGTSVAAPLWAGFMALVNQQAADNGIPPVGFINPAIYGIGIGSDYTNSFNDIVTGDNTWSLSPNRFFAVPGYDLCAGWGSPKGAALMDALNGLTGQPRVEFFTTSYSVDEDAPGYATIRVRNVAGTPGSVDYSTSDGTALAGTNYFESSGTITFEDGQIETNFIVLIIDDPTFNSNRTVNLTLSNPTGGATLGSITNAVLTIVDDETKSFVSTAGEFNFSSWIDSAGFGFGYFATMNESDFNQYCYPLYFIDRGRSALGVLVTVVRTNGNTGRVMVDYRTVDDFGGAFPGIDYFPVSGTLVFDDHQMSANFVVPLRNFTNGFLFGTNFLNFFKFVSLELSNPRPASEEEAARPNVIRPTLGPGSVSFIQLYDVGLGIPTFTGSFTNITFTDAFAFERLHYRFDEHPDRDPRIPGGQNRVLLSVIKRAINGRVLVRTYRHVRGAGVAGINNYPFGASALDFTLGGHTVDAGSDYASSPLGGFEILSNPVYSDPTSTLITNLADYVVRDITLDFGGTCRREVEIVIENDPAVEFNEDIIVQLIQLGGNPPVNPYGEFCNVTILYKDQPAGAVDREWNPDNVEGTPDRSYNLSPGANNTVNAVAVQPDGKTVLGGDFTGVNTKSRNRIARLNADGSVDTGFNSNDGANSTVSSILLYPTGSLLSGRIVIGGSFSSYNSVPRRGIARLLDNGVLDTTFVVGSAANGAVRAMAMQPDGRIIIAGDFTEYNDSPRNGLARLNVDGSLDFTFDPGSSTDGLIWSVVVAPDGLGGSKVLIGGDFLHYNNEFRAGIARLNADGSLDTSFDPGGGANSSVYTMAMQNNGQVLIAGAFNEIDGRRRVGIARLNSNGSLDLTFDPGTGPNNPIYALTLQPDQKALIGGPFTTYNGTRRMGFARLRFDGALDTTFLDTAYNQFAGLVNGMSFEPPNFVNSIAVQPDGNVMIGGAFNSIGGNPSFTADVPNHYTQFTRADKRARYNIARVLGGSTPGPGNTEFEVDDYTVDENGQVASLKLQRADGRLGTVVAIAGTGDRTASVGLDFVNTNLVTAWPESFYQTNLDLTFPVLFPTNFAQISVGKVEPVYLRVPVLDDMLREGDESLDLSFIRPEGSITLGGEVIPLGAALGRSSAKLSIIDNDFDAGTLVFGAPTFFVNENGGFASITVVRTNGANGVISVDYFTTTTDAPAPHATPGTGPLGDYSPSSGRLTFASGQIINTNFTIAIINDTRVEFDENIGLVLTNAGGGAKLPGGLVTSTSKAALTIVDNDFPQGRLNFTLDAYTNNEAQGSAIITVSRTGGGSDTVSVDFRTIDGTATSPSDYSSTNGTLTWNPGDIANKSFIIPLRIDGLPEGTEVLTARLQNGRVNGVASTNLLGFRTNAMVTILDADAYGSVAFNQPFYQADENGGAAIITVVRSGGIAGTGTVNFATSAGSPATAVPGTDYLDTNGVLTFLPGEISKTFTVPLLNDTEPDGNVILLLGLSNPTNVTLGVLSQVTLTLIDNRSFNEPAGALDTLFSHGAQANGPVLALALQATNSVIDGRIVVAGEFTEFNEIVRNRLARLMTNGTLDTTFDPGPGANDAIRTIAMQPNGKLLIGGFFTQVISTNRNRIARLNVDGSLDGSFNPGAGADNPVYAIALQADDRILVGGAFDAFDSVGRPGIVRLNTNGTVDLTFNAGSGANGPVYSIALQADGRILIGGEFSSINGIARNRIARLNFNGSLDTSFDPGSGMNAAVRALLYQPDGKVVAGGSFTTVNGVTRNYLARLNGDGSLDTGFLDSSLSSADNSVFALALQVDGKIMVGGDFTRFNGVTRNRLTRLNGDGRNDPTINFGSGADGFVSSLLIQPDQKIILGGGFVNYDGVRRARIARIHGGSIAGAGNLAFVQSEFLAGENSTNALITVRRRGGTAGMVGVDYQTSDDTAVAGVHYQSVTGTLTFPEAETFQTFVVPIIDNFTPDGDRVLNLDLVANSYTGGALIGPQPSSRLRILDDEGIVAFYTANFSVNEGVPSQLVPIMVTRSGATNGPVSVNFATIAGGSAVAGMDYIATNGILSFLPGESTKSFQIRILDDAIAEGSETVLLALSDASNANVIGVANATLTIVDNEFSPGQFVFSSPAYSVQENATNVLLTVLRTNGSSGFATVTYRTLDGTAVGGVDYVATNHILAFADGERAKTIIIPLNDDLLVEAQETFDVVLFNVTGGASLGNPNTARVTIFENDVSLIVPVTTTLLSESLATNGIIDPGETVTMSFAIRNLGSGDTPSLLGTLLAGTGVTAPTGPQVYGVLVANGPAVARTYTFTASGGLGSSLVATLLLTDGAATNSFVSFAFTIGGQASRSFTNSSPIIINDFTNNIGAASPYPSTINVAGMGGTITKVTATLTNLSHQFPPDIDVLLVGPGGERVMLISDAGGSGASLNPISNVTLTFDGTSANSLSATGRITSGTYRPANFAGPNQNTSDTFPPPAPQPTTNAYPFTMFPYTNINLAVFNGTSPNGLWSLYVVDDGNIYSGSIDGWRLTIETSDPVSASPSASVADVAVSASGGLGTVAVGANMVTSFFVTNNGPAVAEGVAVIGSLPAGMSFVSASSTVGNWTKVQNTLTWTIGAVPSGGGATLTVVGRSLNLGTLATTALVSANQIDPNSANNTTTIWRTVVGLPTLTITRQANNVRIAWPANSGFKLQSADALNPPNWQDVGIVPGLEGSQNVVNVGVGASTKYYRLRSP